MTRYAGLMIAVITLLLFACDSTPSEPPPPIEVEVTRLVEVEVEKEIEVTRLVERIIETEVEVTRLVEVEVTRIVEVPVEVGGGTPMPLPPPAGPDAFIGGHNMTVDDIAQGDAGLNVILVGPPDGDRFPVVVRNNTDAAVYWVEVSATVRNAAGAIIGAGEDTIMRPVAVPPGGLAIGAVRIRDVDFTDATIEYLATGRNEPGSFLDLEIAEHTLAGSNIAGLLLNRNSEQLGLMNMVIVCFDDAFTPLSYHSGTPSQNRVEAGATTPFSVNVRGHEAECERYLLSAGGIGMD